MTKSPRRVSAMTVWALLMMVTALTGCEPGSEVALNQPLATTAMPLLRSHHIDAATWTDGPWPFTVAQGDLGCRDEGHVQVQTFTANGVTYSLNLAAKDTARYLPVDVIWRPDPTLPGFKIDIGEVIDYARKLCRY